MLFLDLQDVAHGSRETRSPSLRSTSQPSAVVAGFQVSINGRIWVSTEDTHSILSGSGITTDRKSTPDLTTRPLRFHVVHHQYVIAYAPDERPLWVVAVFHGRRDPRLVAVILRGRQQRPAASRDRLEPQPTALTRRLITTTRHPAAGCCMGTAVTNWELRNPSSIPVWLPDMNRR